jgi:hypothetical protein
MSEHPENSKKVFVALRALPWHALNVAVGKTEDGKVHSVKAQGDDKHAGFLPVYWDAESAQAENPGAEIKEGAVGEFWGQLNVPQGDQGTVMFGEDVETLSNKDLVKLAKTAEGKLSLTLVALARERHLESKAPSARTGKDKLKVYIRELHKAHQAAAK